MILITGASGFLGGHLARAVAAAGEPIRLLLRSNSETRGIADLVYQEAVGDLRDPESLRQAVTGCNTIYHVAADYRLWARDPGELYASNVEGTRNLLEAAERQGVDRVVYTSTVGTIGVPRNELGNESTPVSVEQMSGHYKRSKFLAEQAALEAARLGLPVVIVNPTAPVGEADLKPTPTGRIILDFLLGRTPAYVDTGLNLVDVRDVAAGHLLAAERGLPGERYVLGARNMTLHEILDTVARLAGRPAPRIRLPYAAAWLFGAAETGLASLTGREPRAPLEAVRMAATKAWVSSAKAERELGWRPGPIEPALQRAIQWFRENQYC